MNRKLFISTTMPGIALLCLLCACGGPRKILKGNAKDQFEASIAAFQAGDYEAAEQGFKRVIFNFPSSVYVDDAQFYLAETYTALKDYEAAVVEYQFLIDNFPGSEYRENALLGVAETYFESAPGPSLDPTDTEKAIFHLRRYLALYPDSKGAERAREMLGQAKDRLAKKLFDSSKTYRRLGAVKSERLYLEILLREYPESSVMWEAKLRLSEILLDLGEKESAEGYLEEILESEGPAEPLKARALGLLSASQES
jgi:outer membrane assembly lipoprotein YfiO